MIGVRAFKLCIVYCVDLNIEGISKITSDFIKNNNISAKLCIAVLFMVLILTLFPN